MNFRNHRISFLLISYFILLSTVSLFSQTIDDKYEIEFHDENRFIITIPDCKPYNLLGGTYKKENDHYYFHPLEYYYENGISNFVTDYVKNKLNDYFYSDFSLILKSKIFSVNKKSITISYLESLNSKYKFVFSENLETWPFYNIYFLDLKNFVFITPQIIDTNLFTNTLNRKQLNSFNSYLLPDTYVNVYHIGTTIQYGEKNNIYCVVLYGSKEKMYIPQYYLTK